MKILSIVHGFPPSALGGAEIYAHAHAVALQRLFGDELLVLTRDQDPARPDYDIRTGEHDGLRVVRINNTFRSAGSFQETYSNDAIGAIAERVIDDFAPDVAHIHHLTCLSTTIVASLAARRIPCMMTLHDYWLLCHRGQLLDTRYQVCEGPRFPGSGEPVACQFCVGPAAGAGQVGFAAARVFRTIEQQLPDVASRNLRRLATTALTFSDAEADRQARERVRHFGRVSADVTRFLAPSRHIRDQFIRAGIAGDRITIAPYGFDHAPFAGIARNRRRPSGPLRLGFLGSLMVSKAPHVLLEAIQRLPPASVSVDLYGSPVPYHGDDSYRGRLAPLLAQQGVHVHGPVAHERIAEALSSMDALVVPSIWPENSPLVIQEAFLAGTPVIASRIGGIPEIVGDDTNGLLFQPGSADALAAAIARLLDDPDLLDRLRAGIPPVRTIEEDVRETRRLYEESVRPAPDSTRVAAVVLNYKTPDDTYLTVKSLLASRQKIHDIIVVDNGAEDRVRMSTMLGMLGDTVRYIPTARNLGFSGGMNVGIRDALARGADRVLLCNSDVMVPPDTLDQLEHSLQAHPDAGIAGPVVFARTDPGRVATMGMSYTPSTGRMRHQSSGELLQERPGDRRVDGVSGCLVLIQRRVLEAIGVLDEDFFFSFEDLEFCLRARRAGFTTVLAGGASVYHEGSRTIGATSPERLYFAARNHLLMAQLTGSTGGLSAFWRTTCIVILNLAHALRANGGTPAARVGAVMRGMRDFAAGRFGVGDRPHT